jgi:hypothetical protein
MRIASKVIDGSDRYAFAKEKGEVLLRRTEGGRQELVAKFFEDDREINVLTIQRFETSGSPHKISVSLVGMEIIKLLDFLVNIKNCTLP